MAWFEPAGTPPSASIYNSNSNSNTNRHQDRHRHRHVDSDIGRSAYSNQMERIMKDPLSRRLMSLISPMLPSAVLESNDATNNNNITTANGTASNVFSTAATTTATDTTTATTTATMNGSLSNSNMLLSPYPHPSFPHRETPPQHQHQYKQQQNSSIQSTTPTSQKTTNHHGMNEHDNDYNDDYTHFFHPQKVINRPDEFMIVDDDQQSNNHHDYNQGQIMNDDDEDNNHNHHNNFHSSHHHQHQQQQQLEYNHYENNTSSYHNQQQQHKQQQHHHQNQNQYNQQREEDIDHHHQQQQQQQQQPNFGHRYHDYFPTNTSQTRQSHFIRNPENGSFQTNVTTATHNIPDSRFIQQDWGQVEGQIGSYHQGIQYDDVDVDAMRDLNHDQNGNRKKRKKKKSKKRGKRKSNGTDLTTGGGDFDTDIHANANDNANEGGGTKRKKKKRTLPDIRDMMSSPQQRNMNEEKDDDDDDGTNMPNMNKTGTKKDQIERQAHFDTHDQNSTFEERRRPNTSSAFTNNDTTDAATTSAAVTTKKRTRQKSKKTRKFTKDKSSSLPPQTETLISSIPYETLRQFVETYEVKNAGSSNDSLREFVRIIKSKKYAAWTMIYQDMLCSTPLFPTSKKYCTEKGPKCIMWNCTCDNQVRAMQAAAPLIGAMFVFDYGDNDDDDDDDNVNENQHNLHTFILPLAPTSDPDDGSTKDIDSGYERMAQWPFLSIACDTTLQQRWDTLRSILIDRHLTCVTFNAQVALMPYHYHCANDVVLNTNDSSLETIGYMDSIVPNIWDLRLASWMLSPHAAEKDLELDKKLAGFSHLLPKEEGIATPANASKQFLGLLQAKKQLEFLHVIYPVINKLLEENGLKDAFDEIESPVQSVLSAMECQGMGFKASRLQQIQTNIESRIEELTNEAHEIANDKSLSLSSPQQVSSLLYDKMGISVPKNGPNKNNTQHRSTSEEVLKLIQKEEKSRNGQSIRIIQILLEFRGLSKMLNTYIKPYPKLARENRSRHMISSGSKRRRSKKSKSESMKMHPMWMQTAVRTGRLSCRKPNIQQIPTGSVLGISPRNAFMASSVETCLFACDYSQNEVRILAHMSGDEALISLFVQPGTTDIYKQMSSVITGKNVDSISSKERSIAKQVTLAIIYGMGLNNVAKKLSITKSTANKFFQSFYGRFSGVKAWMDKVKDSARRQKYVTTISGRRRYLDNIDSPDQKLRSQAERQAVNTVIQGSAADLIKLAMLKMASRITDWRKEADAGTGVPPKLLLQIHDELVFELMANEADVEKLKTTVKRCCTEDCVEELQLKVPLALTCSVGASWGNMKDI